MYRREWCSDEESMCDGCIVDDELDRYGPAQGVFSKESEFAFSRVTAWSRAEAYP